MGACANKNYESYVPKPPKASRMLLQYLFEVFELNKSLCPTEFESWQSFFPQSIAEQLPQGASLLADVNQRVIRAVGKREAGRYEEYTKYPYNVLYGLEESINQACAKILFTE